MITSSSNNIIQMLMKTITSISDNSILHIVRELELSKYTMIDSVIIRNTVRSMVSIRYSSFDKKTTYRYYSQRSLLLSDNSLTKGLITM